MATKIAAKARAPRTSETQCMLARTRPTATRAVRASMRKSRMIRVVLDLMYLGMTTAVRAKTVATSMT